MPDLPTLLWFNEADGHWYERLSAYWEKVNGAVNFGDTNFTGTISVDGDEGLTGTRTIDGHVLTFKNGILTGYQAP